MCAAKVECPDGYRIILPDGQVLDERIEGFNHIPPKDQEELHWSSVLGTSEGFDILFGGGRQDLLVHITPTSVTEDGKPFQKLHGLKKGNVYEYSGGTKITPIADTKVKP